MAEVYNYISVSEFGERDGISCALLKRMALGGEKVGHGSRRQVAPVMVEGTHFVVSGGKVLLNARYRVIRGQIIRME